MGIDVSAAGVVTFNDAHEQRIVTDPLRPMATHHLGPVPVVSIFKRRRVKHDTGDGNPLIFALKGKKGFTIPRRDFVEIYSRAATRLPAALDEVPDFDVVIPLPSSSNVAAILARRVVRLRPGAALLECLEKASVAHVLAMSPAPASLPARVRKPYKRVLSTLQGLPRNSAVEMKRVPLQVRPYINPIIAGPTVARCGGLRVLLVDDIFGSGASLEGAISAMMPSAPASLCGLTFLSRLS